VTTLAEKRHLSRVAELGCIICARPSEIHHLRNGLGLGQRSSHFRVLPLCFDHHRGPYGIGFHAGKKIWQEKFGTEEELLVKVEKMLLCRKRVAA
jgi:hypothetical protein